MPAQILDEREIANSRFQRVLVLESLNLLSTKLAIISPRRGRALPGETVQY